MEDKKRNRFSWPAWSASLAVHATGAILILVAGFHLATPEGSVTDKTEFEALDTHGPLAPQVQAPPAPSEPAAPPPEEAPPVDEAPPQPVVDTQPDEESPPAPTQEAQEVAKADSDPAQDPDSMVAAPVPVGPPPVASPEEAATPGTSQAAAETPAEIPPSTPAVEQGQGGDGSIPDYGTPGTTIDETKLMEAFGNHKPDYPWMARLRRQQGTVILRAFVKKDGNIDQVMVDKSSGFPLLDQEAQRSYTRWRYQPGLTGWVLKPFKFSLK